ncbi:MAG: amidohydrolase, partial [Firmicutes bacterium]|nr:amidohydrolase [Bacillota bacterium]
MNKFIGYRREFHHFPEQGWDEVRTTSRIYEILTDMGYDCLIGLEVCDEATIDDEMRTPEQRRANMDRAVAQGAQPDIVEKTQGFPGVLAVFDTGKPGPVTAFRFDIDCLPGNEPHKEGFRPFDEGYISCNEGCVHA